MVRPYSRTRAVKKISVSRRNNFHTQTVIKGGRAVYDSVLFSFQGIHFFKSTWNENSTGFAYVTLCPGSCF